MVRALGATLALSVAATVGLVLAAGGQAVATQSQEAELFAATNAARGDAGLAGLAYDSAASTVARNWAQYMANTGGLAHNPSLVSDVSTYVTNQWTRIGENVGFGYSIASIESAFVNSTPHRNNILGQYNRVGVGAVQGGDGRIWVSVVFIQGPPLVAPPLVASGVGSVARDDGRLEVVERALDGTIRIRTYAGTWSEWQSLGGAAQFDADVSAWGNNRLDVFAIGTDNALWHRAQVNGTWGAWENLGGYATSSPTAVSWGNNRIDVLTRGGDGAVWGRTWDGTRWLGWYSLGGYTSSAPSVSSWGPGRLDVFAAGGDLQLWHRAYGGSWFGWEPLGGRLTSAPGAVSWGVGRADIFARGGDGSVYSIAWLGTHWGGWYSVGGSSVGAPDATSRGPGLLDVMTHGTDGRVFARSWTGLDWTGWFAVS